MERGNDANELGKSQKALACRLGQCSTLEIHERIIDLLPPDKLAMARGFLKVKLMLEGPTLQGTGDLVFYDLFQKIRWFS